MNIVPWQSQDEQPSAALKIIFKLLFETPLPQEFLDRGGLGCLARGIRGI